MPSLPSAYLHEYTGNRLMAVITALTSPGIAPAGLRYYLQSMHSTPIELDDILVTPVLVFSASL